MLPRRHLFFDLIVHCSTANKVLVLFASVRVLERSVSAQVLCRPRPSKTPPLIEVCEEKDSRLADMVSSISRLLNRNMVTVYS